MRTTTQTINDYCYKDENNYEELTVKVKVDEDKLSAMVEIGDHRFESGDFTQLAKLVSHLTNS